jgi:putative hemolysin
MPVGDSVVENITEHLQQSALFTSAKRLAARFLPFDKVQELYGRVQSSNHGLWFEDLLREMQISLSVAEMDLRRIPRSGAVLAVSNHPFGMLDGTVLGALLTRVRSDVKIMTNFPLTGVAELQEHCIFVDPLNENGSAERNRLALKQALLWLSNGHMLAAFPAGDVSHLQLTSGGVTDPKWNPMMAGLARSTRSAVLPVFFQGRNSMAFQALRLIHPGRRSAWLMNEFLSQRGKTLDVRVGTAIPGSTVAALKSDEGAIDYLRRRTYLLGQRHTRTAQSRSIASFPFPLKVRESIAPEIDKERLAAEIRTLRSEQCVEETRDFSVFVARAAEIPQVLQELGRLREMTFRDAGEGCGRSRDLDEFDDYYLHIFLWDKRSERLAGAYRMGVCPEILATRGPAGLYTSTLFHFDPEFFEKLGPALELGRSFVAPEYQRQFASLLLLWKGIGSYISRHPETPVLFGAVSISSRYNSASRELIVRYFESRRREDVSRFVRPRRPFRPFRFNPWDCAGTSRALRDLSDLGDSVSDLEADAKSIPVLFRQYAKLGGTLLAFNVDRNFSDVLDGLVLLDLRETDPVALERYTGKEGLQRFRRYHGMCVF